MRRLQGLLLLACAAGPALAQISARARIDSTEFFVGDPITVHVDLHHPEGTVLRRAEFDTSSGFVVLQAHPFGTPGPTLTRGEYVVARYDSVQTVIPPVTVWYSLPGDTATRTVSTNQLVVTVRTVQVDTSQQFKDLKPPLAVPISWLEVAIYAGSVLLLAVLGWLAYRFWKKRQARRSGEEYHPPARPAHVIALEELATLKEKQLWQQGKIKEYYSELTEILRRYFEHRYAHPALEETTDEILSGLQKLRFPSDMLVRIETLLRRADLAKFAKQRPAVTEHEDSMAAVYDVVDRTKIVAMTPVPSGEAQEGTRVAG
jgi:hypothetical protein